MFKNLKKCIFLMVTCILVSSFLLACTNKKENTNVAETKRKITDMAGREHTVDGKIDKVYCTSPVGNIIMYTLAQEKLVGIHSKLSDMEKKYLTKEYQDLPVLGGWFGKDNQGNIEEIIKAKPQVVLSIGDVNDTAKSQADKIQEQLGIPVILVESKLQEMDKTYKFLGDLLGVEERAKDLGDYCKNTIEEAKKVESKIPEDKRKKVYYAEGQKGLETDPKGSPHAEVLDVVGGINVAKVESKSGYGRTQVSIEQVLNWNPEVIIISPDKGVKPEALRNEILTSDSWKNIKAVKDKEVYTIPLAPFNWFDRPPAVNRILGVKWMTNLLYKEESNMDLNKEVKEFFKKFYHKDLSDEELKEVIKDAVKE
ncbi:iron ABC transporter substrate-binding protein [Clostridium hydrogeniformans]|uniref:iron ABC transporter substrate-binding protein n=1 Tax=Clostridium hydrogeniformans TaxID=349933 RepID=UPI00048A3144|nr:iron ABC transporter substrate-binding protein [Clostridium hydrogeniformans]